MGITFATGAQLVNGAVELAPTPAPVDPQAPAPTLAPAPGEGQQPTAEETAQPGTTPETPDTVEPTDGDDGEDALVLPPTTKSQRAFVRRLMRENAQFQQQVPALQEQLATVLRLFQQQQPQPPGQAQPQGQPAPSQQPPAQGDGRPTRPNPEQFADQRAYLDAYDQYTVELARWTTQQTLTQERATQAQTAAQQEWQAREQQGQSKYPDYQLVVQRLAFSPQAQYLAADAFRKDDVGPDIFYHLGTHPETLARLNQAPSLLAAAEVLREVRMMLTTPASQATRQAPTATPHPVVLQPVGGGQAPQAVVGFSRDMGLGNYERMRNQEGVR